MSGAIREDFPEEEGLKRGVISKCEHLHLNHLGSLSKA